ncbi:protein PML isoform X2 [Anas platyrhynchos]|uniref:protein PML isoform X2 n=1 Tax=Anas platyrhynchos TaxID=8839 RepID=UPI003AF23D53
MDGKQGTAPPRTKRAMEMLCRAPRPLQAPCPPGKAPLVAEPFLPAISRGLCAAGLPTSKVEPGSSAGEIESGLKEQKEGAEGAEAKGRLGGELGVPHSTMASPDQQQQQQQQQQEEEEDFQFVLCEGCRQESPSLKLLTCLHSLCLGCLSEKKPVGQCPVCQEPIPQPNGIPEVDNVLFASLQARLRVYRRIAGGAELLCDNCRREGEYWCSECEEFLCTTCFEAHQRYLKRESHEARKVTDIRAGALKDFLQGARRTGSLACSNPTHKNQTLSIYCKKCEKLVCCICALLDTQHAGQHCDIGAEIQRRQEELAAAGRELARRRGGFEASRAALQEEAARLEAASGETRELIRQRVEQLVRLVRREEAELLGLVERRREQGRRELAGELRRVEGVLRRMEAGERLVEKMRLYATEQEVMDMQPFVREALRELQRLRPPAAGGRAQHGDFAECRARLQALAERVEGHAEAAPAPATEDSHQAPSTSTPAKRKTDKDTNTLPSPVKVMKVEEDDDGWNMLAEPQRLSCEEQPGTSFLRLAMDDNLLEGMLDGNGGLCGSADSNNPSLESAEEDSVDEDSKDSSLLEGLGNMLDDGTSEEHLGFPIRLQNTMDTRQGSLVFFDVKILKNEIIQMAVIDGEQILPVLIQPVKCLPSLMAKNSVCEVGLRSLLGHLYAVHQPILGGFRFCSLPLPTLLEALTVLGKREEFSAAVYGFLDILPLIKEKVPERDNYRLKNLASSYLWRDLSDHSAMESARAVKDLCEVLDIDLLRTPRLVLSHASLECWVSLQPLLEEKLLNKASAQRLASCNVGLSELWSCHRHDPGQGLQKLRALLNAHRHGSEKKIRTLSKVQLYFQRQQEDSREAPAGSNVPKDVKNKEN